MRRGYLGGRMELPARVPQDRTSWSRAGDLHWTQGSRRAASVLAAGEDYLLLCPCRIATETELAEAGASAGRQRRAADRPAHPGQRLHEAGVRAVGTGVKAGRKEVQQADLLGHVCAIAVPVVFDLEVSRGQSM